MDASAKRFSPPLPRVVCLVAVLCALLVACQSPTALPVKLGLISPLSGGSGPSGEAIQRGMLLAIEEVNRDGGVLGRTLALVTRDVQNDPAAGDAALRELLDNEGIVAVFGGIFSPVMVAQLDTVHAREIPLINPWGSLAAITRNGRDPNYAFRVSLSDASADEFLARYAVEVVGARRPGILADSTAWGDANLKELNLWLTRLGAPPVAVARFDQGETSMRHQLEQFRAADPDAALLVSPGPAGGAVMRGMATLGWKVPVISHWGISGGGFVETAGTENAEGVLTLQTYSFYGQLSPQGQAVLQAYHARFGTRRIEDVQAPVGVAHGYDAVHLLARAMRQAGTVDGPSVREALEHLDTYDGLLKRYAPAFTPEDHDALHAEDYLMTVWQDGRLVPAAQPHLPNR
jgi:branched-chain amino acid transport system substrate-binding protein